MRNCAAGGPNFQASTAGFDSRTGDWATFGRILCPVVRASRPTAAGWGTRCPHRWSAVRLSGVHTVLDGGQVAARAGQARLLSTRSATDRNFSRARSSASIQRDVRTELAWDRSIRRSSSVRSSALAPHVRNILAVQSAPVTLAAAHDVRDPPVVDHDVVRLTRLAREAEPHLGPVDGGVPVAQRQPVRLAGAHVLVVADPDQRLVEQPDHGGDHAVQAEAWRGLSGLA